MSGTESIVAELYICLGDLTLALRMITRLSHLIASNTAVFRFSEGELKIELPEMSLGVPAKGRWDGQARVDISFLRALAGTPPVKDPVVFRVSSDRLRMDTLSVGCIWEVAAPNPVWLPLNRSFGAVLRLNYQYTPSEIERAGLADVVAKAVEKRNKRVESAYHALRDFGVTLDELRALVDAKMGDGSQR